MSAQKMGRFPPHAVDRLPKGESPDPPPPALLLQERESHPGSANPKLHRLAEVQTSLKVWLKKCLLDVGGGMGSYFFSDMPLTTIRKRKKSQRRCLLLKLTRQIEQAFQL